MHKACEIPSTTKKKKKKRKEKKADAMHQGFH
jgi:hypothetical protein